MTGHHRFVVASSTAASLVLAESPLPLAKRTIATSSGATARAWDAGSTSPRIWMVAGQRYYLELLFKALGEPGEHAAVVAFSAAVGLVRRPG